MVPRQLVPLAEQNNRHIAQLFAEFPKITPTVAFVANERITTRFTTVVQDGKAPRIDMYGASKEVIANQPKLAYDPLTSNPLGIQVDPGYTNFIRQSKAVGIAPWALGGLDIGSGGELIETAGTDSIEKVVSQSVAVNGYIGYTSAITNKRITYTAIVRRVVGTRNVALRLTTPEAAVKTLIVDLGTGEVLSATGLSIPDHDVWVQKVSDTAFVIRMSTDLVSDGGYTVEVLTTNGVTLAYAGDGVSSIHVDAIQLSDSVFTVPVLTTSDAVVTHAPEQYVLDLNLSGGVHQVETLEGTALVEFFERDEHKSAGTEMLLTLGTASADLFGISASGTGKYRLTVWGTETRFVDFEYQIGTELRRIVARYSQNKLTIQINDEVPVTLDIGTNIIPNLQLTKLRIGHALVLNPVSYTTSYIRRIFYFPKYLADTQAAALAHPMSYADMAQ